MTFQPDDIRKSLTRINKSANRLLERIQKQQIAIEGDLSSELGTAALETVIPDQGPLEENNTKLKLVNAQLESRISTIPEPDLSGAEIRNMKRRQSDIIRRTKDQVTTGAKENRDRNDLLNKSNEITNKTLSDTEKLKFDGIPQLPGEIRLTNQFLTFSSAIRMLINETDDLTTITANSEGIGGEFTDTLSTSKELIERGTSAMKQMGPLSRHFSKIKNRVPEGKQDFKSEELSSAIESFKNIMLVGKTQLNPSKEPFAPIPNVLGLRGDLRYLPNKLNKVSDNHRTFTEKNNRMAMHLRDMTGNPIPNLTRYVPRLNDLLNVQSTRTIVMRDIPGMSFDRVAAKLREKFAANDFVETGILETPPDNIIQPVQGNTISHNQWLQAVGNTSDGTITYIVPYRIGDDRSSKFRLQHTVGQLVVRYARGTQRTGGGQFEDNARQILLDAGIIEHIGDTYQLSALGTSIKLDWGRWD